ncbi:MAG: hypothetical protein ACYDCP_09925 [Thermoplasmataceae archaeon]
MDDSNIGAVVEWLRDFVEGFDFTRPGKDQSLGRDLANQQVRQIMIRSSQFLDPMEEEWAGNSRKSSPWLPGGYKEWKEATYEWDDAPNYRTGQMLSQLSLFGRTTIEPRLITLRYGIDAPPDRSTSPNGFFDRETDGKVTDLQKAEWAHTQTPDKPARRFYDFGAGDAEALADVARESLHAYIRASPYGGG